MQNQGAAGECCTQCTNDPACTDWSYHGGTTSLKPTGPGAWLCSLYGGDLGPEARAAAPMGTISGKSGTFVSAKWTAHPQHYRDSGYLTLGTGKVWHTEEGGLSMGSPGAGPNGGMGTGMPPSQDPPSWSLGCSMSAVNAVANMFTCPTCDGVNNTANCKKGGSQGCPIQAAAADGTVTDPNVAPLCDKIIGDDAVAKLKLAAAFTVRTGRPWFLACGFRKPHMPWRFPASFLQLYAPPAGIKLAEHRTLDPSVPPIAHHTPDLQSKSVSTTPLASQRMHVVRGPTDPVE